MEKSVVFDPVFNYGWPIVEKNENENNASNTKLVSLFVLIVNITIALFKNKD
jgi:hypothetical protein